MDDALFIMSLFVGLALTGAAWLVYKRSRAQAPEKILLLICIGLTALWAYALAIYEAAP